MPAIIPGIPGRPEMMYNLQLYVKRVTAMSALTPQGAKVMSSTIVSR